MSSQTHVPIPPVQAENLKEIRSSVRREQEPGSDQAVEAAGLFPGAAVSQEERMTALRQHSGDISAREGKTI